MQLGYELYISLTPSFEKRVHCWLLNCAIQSRFEVLLLAELSDCKLVVA